MAGFDQRLPGSLIFANVFSNPSGICKGGDGKEALGMKIGIMVSSQLPQAGGGFTYEQEILSALFRLKRELPHEFILVGYQRERPAHWQSADLPWLSLYRPKALRRRQKLSGLLEKIGRGLGAKKKRRPLDSEAYPDLVKHPLDLIFYPTPLVRPVADIPYITNVWDVEHRRQPFFPEISLYGEWESREERCRKIFPRAAYVLTPNEQGKKELVAYYGISPERIRTLAHPTPAFALEQGNAPHEVKSLQHLGLRGDFLFYPAQFWPHKNHSCLLLTLQNLRQVNGYAPQLVLTGADKGNRKHIEQMARSLGLQDQVVFTGFVAREELVALYRQALALLYPSFCGPENLPPLEAFALGCPVIASAIPGHREQLGDAALLVDPVQPELWAESIMRLREDDALCQGQIVKGKARAVRYTSDDFARGLFRIFREFEAYRRCWPTGSPP